MKNFAMIMIAVMAIFVTFSTPAVAQSKSDLKAQLSTAQATNAKTAADLKAAQKQTADLKAEQDKAAQDIADLKALISDMRYNQQPINTPAAQTNPQVMPTNIPDLILMNETPEAPMTEIQKAEQALREARAAEQLKKGLLAVAKQYKATISGKSVNGNASLKGHPIINYKEKTVTIANSDTTAFLADFTLPDNTWKLVKKPK